MGLQNSNSCDKPRLETISTIQRGTDEALTDFSLCVTCSMSEARAGRNIFLCPVTKHHLSQLHLGSAETFSCGLVQKKRTGLGRSPGMAYNKAEHNGKLLLAIINKHCRWKTHRGSGSPEDARACHLLQSGCEEQCIFPH